MEELNLPVTSAPLATSLHNTPNPHIPSAGPLGHERVTNGGPISGKDRRGLLELRERQIEAVRTMAGALFARYRMEDLVPEILEVAIVALDGEVGSVQLHDPLKDELVFRFVKDPKSDGLLLGHRIPASHGIAGRVFRSGQATITHKAPETPEFNQQVDQLTGYKTESMLTAPIMHLRGRPIGIIQVLNSTKQFDVYDLEVLEILCSFAATSLEMARMADDSRKAELVNLMGDVSHDIKNMLTPIQSGIITLQSIMESEWDQLENSVPEAYKVPVQRYIEDCKADTEWILENALAACEQIQVRTSQIADAVKGKPTALVLGPTQANEVLQQVAASLRILMANSGLTLELQLDPELPLIMADRGQLYNAFYNLTNNAIPETPPGGSITLSSSLVECEEAAPHVMLCVSDTGRGMPDEVRDKLFTTESVSTKAGGTGLGTRIVANVVAQHSGRIEVLSEAGQGTTFQVTLPLIPPPVTPHFTVGQV